MQKKFALGRGLGALIPDETEEMVSENAAHKISINQIKNNSKQPRKIFDDEKLSELAESVKVHGIIQPLILKKAEDECYEIVAGERRWRAAKLAGLKEVPAVVMDLSEKDTLEISLIENIQRQDLNPIEEAMAYKKLIDDFNLTQENLSETIGKSRTAIANTMRLLNLEDRVKEYIVEGLLSEGHGRALLSVKEKSRQYEISQHIIKEGLSVRETEKLIKSLGNRKKQKKENTRINPYYKDITNQLEEYFGTKVNITNKKDKGKIEIEYYSSDDLQRILNIINN